MGRGERGSSADSDDGRCDGEKVLKIVGGVGIKWLLPAQENRGLRELKVPPVEC